eukprot:CAMPEP_0115034428 /NCGR_PEP_ID=MMETSP0216-20121206/40641_1 /TAXON_ID=223996 /ORGANISM="Protocruzia adherens, Strain Boccale" /LENGTH=60 /DNA_ID=CAMNT_0002413303 /DNA_START=179 /DNA_END=361 /DNA_ORIENTATION=+
MAMGVRFENAAQLDMNDIVSDKIFDEAHVWIMLKEDMMLQQEEGNPKGKKGRNRPQTAHR